LIHFYKRLAIKQENGIGIGVWLHAYQVKNGRGGE